MRTIQLEVEDRNYDVILTIINNLKDNLIKSFKVDTKSVNNLLDKEEQEIKLILDNRTKEDKEIAFSKIVKIDI